MLTLRKSSERGYADHGWLKSFHSFSFANYYDPRHVQWGNLRVINEDKIAAGMGFGTHSHRNMEIVSYVLSGVLAHKDSMGNIEGIPPGDVQRMSAGTGVSHSEFNHADGQETHFLQIWIQPSELDIAPSYEQKTVPTSAKRGQLALIASAQGDDHAVVIHADAKIYAGLFDGDEHTQWALDSNRLGYIFLIKGTLKVNDIVLNAGDALLIKDENNLHLSQGQQAEVLVFDLATH